MAIQNISIISDIKQGISLAQYSTYNIGGPAKFLIETEAIDRLINAIRWAKSEGIKYLVVGCGANLLFSDTGYDGLIIINQTNKFFFKDTFLIAKSGALISDLISTSCDKELSGLEHFAGIPSTVGGALWQNLHFLSPDRTKTMFIGDILVSADILLEDNSIITVDKEFFNFGYDKSTLHNRQITVLSATFKLAKSTKEDIQKTIESNLAWRNAKHPNLQQYPSCGSVFKNIEGIGVGRLIDEAGLKGVTCGNAQISPMHANFIVNLGNAKSEDVTNLIKLAQTKVKDKFGYPLEPEITVVE